MTTQSDSGALASSVSRASLDVGASKLRVRPYAQTKQSLVTPEARYWKQFKQYAAVTSVAFSPSAPFDFAVCASTRVLVYDAASNAVKRTLSRFTNVVYGASFRHDGRVLLAGGEEGVVRLCDVGSREILRTLSGHERAVHATTFLSDGRAASAGDDTVVRVWDVSTGQCTSALRGHTDRVRALTLLDPSPNANGSASSAALLVSGSYDHSVRVWDVRQARAALSLVHAAPVESLCALGSAQIASVGGAELKVWDALQGTAQHTLSNHQKTVTGVCFDASRSRVLTCGLDQHVKVYSSVDWHVLHTLKYPAPLLCLALSPAHSHLVTGMTDGMLSIRHRALGAVDAEEDESRSTPMPWDEAESERSEATESLHNWRYWDRGRAEKAQADDYTPVSSTGADKNHKLRSHDAYLNKFQYKKALDAVLESGDAPLICSLLEELSTRGALRVALAGRTASSLKPLLAFLVAHVTKPAFARVLIPLTQLVLDMYASVVGESKHVDKLLQRLGRVVRAECQAQLQLTHTMGVLDTLFAAQTAL